MTDVAFLGLAVDSTEVVQSDKALDGLANAAKRAETATEGVTGASKAAAVAAKASAASTHMAAAANDNLARASRMAAMQQRNLAFQLNDVFVSLASGMNPLMVAIQQGSQIGQIYGPGEGGIGRAFAESGKMIARLFLNPVGLGLTGFAAAAGAVFASIRREIKETTGESVSFGNVFKATMIVAGKNIYSVFEPALNWIGDKFNWLFDLIITGLRKIGLGDFIDEVEAVAVGLQHAEDAAGSFGRTMDDAWAFLRDDNGFISYPFEAIKRWDEAHERMKEIMLEQERLAQQLGSRFGDLFLNIVDGTTSARDALASLLKDLARALAQHAFMNIFRIAMGLPTMPLFPRAEGGPVTRGGSYLVGERGPELFVPNSSGSIVPNHAMGGGGFSPVINVDARGAGPGVGPEIERHIEMALDRFSRNKLPGRVKQINRDPYAVG